MRIDFVFLADSATQRPDGRIDAVAIGAFVVMAAHFPTECERFAVVIRGSFESDETEPGTVRVQVVAPGGARVAERDVTIAPPPPLTRPKPEGRVRTRVVNFYNVPVPEPGTYYVRAAFDGMDYIGAHFEALRDSEAPAETASDAQTATAGQQN